MLNLSVLVKEVTYEVLVFFFVIRDYDISRKQAEMILEGKSFCFVKNWLMVNLYVSGNVRM